MLPARRLVFFSAAIAALAAVLALVLPAGTASAAAAPAAETRVWAFSLAAQDHVRADRLVPAGQRLGKAAWCPFCVSGACVAPEDLNGGLGELVSVNAKDPAAQALAQRIGGQASVRFANGPANEFDAVSNEYVAQAKPANFTLNQAFRNQAKTTFEVAIQSGRTPYFQFDGPPGAGVLQALNRYASRYGIEPVIDLTPLGGN